MMTLMIIAIFSLCLGSFLNMLAYRLVHDKSLLIPRSFCPSCFNIIAWYDNVPVVSYLILGGRARCCKNNISWLYPIIELITPLLVVLLWLKYGSLNQHHYFFTYLFAVSALIVSVRTDLDAMVIPQLCTLYLVPCGILFSYCGVIPITINESMLGAAIGYGSLWLVNFLYKCYSGQDGLGVGDMELLAMIGSFFGPFAVWYAIMYGSYVGLLIGGSYLLLSRKESSTPLPFGPSLVMGLFIYLFWMI